MTAEPIVQANGYAEGVSEPRVLYVGRRADVEAQIRRSEAEPTKTGEQLKWILTDWDGTFVSPLAEPFYWFRFVAQAKLCLACPVAVASGMAILEDAVFYLGGVGIVATVLASGQVRSRFWRRLFWWSLLIGSAIGLGIAAWYTRFCEGYMCGIAGVALGLSILPLVPAAIAGVVWDRPRRASQSSDSLEPEVQS